MCIYLCVGNTCVIVTGSCLVCDINKEFGIDDPASVFILDIHAHTNTTSGPITFTHIHNNTDTNTQTDTFKCVCTHMGTHIYTATTIQHRYICTNTYVVGFGGERGGGVCCLLEVPEGCICQVNVL